MYIVQLSFNTYPNTLHSTYKYRLFINMTPLTDCSMACYLGNGSMASTLNLQECTV